MKKKLEISLLFFEERFVILKNKNNTDQLYVKPNKIISFNEIK